MRGWCFHPHIRIFTYMHIYAPTEGSARHPMATQNRICIHWYRSDWLSPAVSNVYTRFWDPWISRPSKTMHIYAYICIYAASWCYPLKCSKTGFDKILLLGAVSPQQKYFVTPIFHQMAAAICIYMLIYAHICAYTPLRGRSQGQPPSKFPTYRSMPKSSVDSSNFHQIFV